MACRAPQPFNFAVLCGTEETQGRASATNAARPKVDVHRGGPAKGATGAACGSGGASAWLSCHPLCRHAVTPLLRDAMTLLLISTHRARSEFQAEEVKYVTYVTYVALLLITHSRRISGRGCRRSHTTPGRGGQR